MMIIIVFLMILFCANPVYSEDGYAVTREYEKALQVGAKAKVTVLVVDDNGKCVSNASVRVYFRMSSGPSQGEVFSGVSDKNGLFSAEGRTTDSIFIAVEKEKYYTYRTKYVAQSLDPAKLDKDKWLPWNPSITTVLREVKNPVPMYVSFAATDKNAIHMVPFPVDKDVGFDCTKNEFVNPYGNGETTDFYVRVSSLPLPKEFEHDMEVAKKRIDTATNTLQRAQFEMEYKQYSRYYYEFTLSVPDSEGGFIRKKKKSDTAFISDYEAPLNGYSSVFYSYRNDEYYPDFNFSTDLSQDEYFIFRSRIIRDENGEIISSHYGKIYGPIKHGIIRHLNMGYMTFECYFNPEPNNRSIEFDGKNNLFYPQYKTSNFAP